MFMNRNKQIYSNILHVFLFTGAIATFYILLVTGAIAKFLLTGAMATFYIFSPLRIRAKRDNTAICFFSVTGAIATF